MLGVPFDANSSYLRGSALAPRFIREALYCSSTNLWTEDGIDLGRPGALNDVGDTPPDFEGIETAVSQALDLGHPAVYLGGDHSVTYPIMRAFSGRFPDLTIVQFDAHPDLNDVFDGNRFSHACQFARIMEERLARRLVQVGIRTMSGHQLQQAERFGVEVIAMRDLEKFAALKFEGPVYISFDMDVMDPAFVPGVSHYEPGGMSVREAIASIQTLKARIVGADIVEFNPARDRENQTGMVAAKILKEIAAAMLRGWR